MRSITIETDIVVSQDRSITVQLPPEVVPGKHRAILVVDEKRELSPKSEEMDFSGVQSPVNHSALKTLKSVLIQQYPEYIDQIILFGSRVNGTAREYSDYDILLIVKKSYDRQFKDEISDICYDINLEYDIIIDIQIISQEELQTLRGKQPCIQNAINTGIIL